VRHHIREVERDPTTPRREHSAPSERSGPRAPLRSIPVLLSLDPSVRPAILAGLARAGGHPDVRVVDLTADVPGTPAIELATEPPPEAIVLSVSGDVAALVRAAVAAADLGGVLLSAVSTHLSSGPDPETLVLLTDPELPPANVPVPAIEDDEERRRIWEGLIAAGVGERHHLVDVDGKPAVDELADVGPVVEGDIVSVLAAGAAGVLAGRMVAGNRSWRAHLEP
jgi:hypothetical protein